MLRWRELHIVKELSLTFRCPYHTSPWVGCVQWMYEHQHSKEFPHYFYSGFNKGKGKWWVHSSLSIMNVFHDSWHFFYTCTTISIVDNKSRTYMLGTWMIHISSFVFRCYKIQARLRRRTGCFMQASLKSCFGTSKCPLHFAVPVVQTIQPRTFVNFHTTRNCSELNLF